MAILDVTVALIGEAHLATAKDTPAAGVGRGHHDAFIYSSPNNQLRLPRSQADDVRDEPSAASKVG